MPLYVYKVKGASMFEMPNIGLFMLKVNKLEHLNIRKDKLVIKENITLCIGVVKK